MTILPMTMTGNMTHDYFFCIEILRLSMTNSATNNCNTGNSDGDESCPLAELKSSQSRERKQIQAKMTALKQGVPKNDKKLKKEVAQQCEKMEAELKERHSKELQALTEKLKGTAISTESQNNGALMQTEAIREANEAESESTPAFFKESKLTKAQIKKEKKRNEKASTRAAAVAQDAAEAQFSQGSMEGEALQRVLIGHSLQLVEIAPDGDCLYSAISHQTNATYSSANLRKLAADYIRKRQDEFLPFLVDDEENPLDEIAFDDYCCKVSRTSSQGGAWGGEPELRALSFLLQRRIEVLHANGLVNVFGAEFKGRPLIITYHKFAYTLGEHYNSTAPIKD